ncbi:hypothetical protein H5073_17955 [Shewanella sp. SR44-3]|nr:hypothetical protein [Shewanella sp. SR44-3]MBB1271193.1 hypothetical protein [Shewanella sp. SR44-3]
MKGEQPDNLLPFVGNERQHQPKGIAFGLDEEVFANLLQVTLTIQWLGH